MHATHISSILSAGPCASPITVPVFCGTRTTQQKSLSDAGGAAAPFRSNAIGRFGACSQPRLRALSSRRLEDVRTALCRRETGGAELRSSRTHCVLAEADESQLLRLLFGVLPEVHSWGQCGRVQEAEQVCLFFFQSHGRLVRSFLGSARSPCTLPKISNL